MSTRGWARFAIAQRQIVAIARALVRRGQGHLHGRADLVADPDRKPTGCSTSCARFRQRASPSSSSATGSRRCLRFRAASPCFATASSSASIPTEGMTPVAAYRADDRQDVRPNRQRQGPRAVAGRSEGRGPDPRTATIDDVSLTIRRGETLGSDRPARAPAAPSWRCRSSACCGPTAARSRSTASPLDLHSNRDAIRAGIGYLSEDRLSLGLIQPQSIADNLVLPVLDKILDRGLISYGKKEALVAHWIDDLAIKIGRADRCDLDAFGRQSAARRHRQMAGGRASS